MQHKSTPVDGLLLAQARVQRPLLLVADAPELCYGVVGVAAHQGLDDLRVLPSESGQHDRVRSGRHACSAPPAHRFAVLVLVHVQGRVHATTAKRTSASFLLVSSAKASSGQASIILCFSGNYGILDIK